MVKVRQVLQNKGNDVWSIQPDATVYEALQFMADKNIGALLVLDKGKIVGIFSERDYARKGVLKGKSAKDTPVADLMTKNVVTIDPEASIKDCMRLMTKKRFRHLPVVENDELIGVVSIGDVVNRVISEQEYTIQDLENYITGKSF